MAVRELLQVGHPALKAPNQEIVDFSAPELGELITDLIETMHATGLIGIAAPQIGKNLRIFVTEPRKVDVKPSVLADDLRVYINPKIVNRSEETQTVIFEGCGSVLQAKASAPIRRPKIIEVEAYDINGDRFSLRADGILGRAVQHEVDHLDGYSFLDRTFGLAEVVKFYLKSKESRLEHLEAQKITIKEFHMIK